MKLGSLTIDFPFALAALAGYSDYPTRLIAARMGAGFTMGEVLLDRFVLNVTKGRKAKRYIRPTGDGFLTGAQVMGSDGQEVAAAAVRLVQADFDWIDVNFGCPVKKVVGKCRGGYLLGHPDSALEILGRVRDAVPPRMPVTVKMRRGLDDSPESREHFFAIFDGAFRLGIAAVTLHGRTVAQRYDGRSSWQFLREAKERAGSGIVIGSGDLFSAQDCLDMIRETGVDGVTAARGAIGNPWIFPQIQSLWSGRPLPDPPGLLEQREVIDEHFGLAEAAYGSERCCYVMRKFAIKYSQLHPQSERVRDTIIKIRTRGDWEAMLARWYADDLPGRYPPSQASG